MSYYCKPTRDERTKINRALDRWGAFEFFKDKGLDLLGACFSPHKNTQDY